MHVSPFFRKNENKPDVIASPDWGSFRDFWTNCEMTITPHLMGFIDIEGGHVGVAGKWLDTCTNCSSQTLCKDCGRKPSNYLQVRAGDGDGVYSVFELHFEQLAVGAFVILDEAGQFALPLVNSIDETAQNIQEDPSILGDFYSDLYQYFYESINDFDRSLEMIQIGELKVEANPVYKLGAKAAGILIIGESGQGKNSNQSLVTINNISTGNYKVFIFASRDIDNNNILVPRALLILAESAAEGIGLTNGFTRSLDLKDEYLRWDQSVVLARIGDPMASPVIITNLNWSELRFAREQSFGENINLANALDMKMEALSWLLLLQAHSPSAELKETINQNLRDLEIDKETIHDARGQFERNLL